MRWPSCRATPALVVPGRYRELDLLEQRQRAPSCGDAVLLEVGGEPVTVQVAEHPIRLDDVRANGKRVHRAEFDRIDEDLPGRCAVRVYEQGVAGGDDSQPAIRR